MNLETGRRLLQSGPYFYCFFAARGSSLERSTKLREAWDRLPSRREIDQPRPEQIRTGVRNIAARMVATVRPGECRADERLIRKPTNFRLNS